MKELAYTQEAKPLVSVIMPSYNAEKYIKEAIESVIAQTYTNWELFVIDDSSTDRTAEIARSYAEKDSRIILHRNSHNMGTAKTRNTGIKLANGEWIATLDSDDIWHPEKLEIQLKKAAKTGSLFLYTSYSLFCEGFRQEYTVPEKIDYSSLLTENGIGCSTVMMNRSILEKHLFPSEVYHEDYALWLELLRAGYNAVGCTEVLTEWRIVKNSRSFNKRKSAKNRWIIYRKMEKLPLYKSIRVFIAYAYHGFKKHKRL